MLNILLIMREELTGEMESRIVASAMKVFVKNGKAGASMQEIAQEAGINRTLLNYYFRKKDKLFELVFERVFLQYVTEIAKIFNAQMLALEKLDRLIDYYFDLLSNNPAIPVFLFQELSTSPERLIEDVKLKGLNPDIFLSQLKDDMDKGKIRIMDPKQLVINILSMIVFPFAAKPFISGMMFNGSEDEFQNFIQERQIFLKSFLKETLKI
jgi:TetR/AcrR family transcriptional regulator